MDRASQHGSLFWPPQVPVWRQMTLPRRPSLYQTCPAVPLRARATSCKARTRHPRQKVCREQPGAQSTQTRSNAICKLRHSTVDAMEIATVWNACVGHALRGLGKLAGRSCTPPVAHLAASYACSGHVSRVLADGCCIRPASCGWRSFPRLSAPACGWGDQRCDDGLAGLIPRRPLLAASASVVEAHSRRGGRGTRIGWHQRSGESERPSVLSGSDRVLAGTPSFALSQALSSLICANGVASSDALRDPSTGTSRGTFPHVRNLSRAPAARCCAQIEPGILNVAQTLYIILSRALHEPQPAAPTLDHGPVLLAI